MICYGFDTFSEASYNCWLVQQGVLCKLLDKKFDMYTNRGWGIVPPGMVEAATRRSGT